MTERTRTGPPPEWWEHLAARPAAWLAARPATAARLRRVRAVGTWVALPVLAAMLVLVPSTRESARAYAWSFAMLVVWFLLVRTKTVSWAGTARWFSLCVAWSAVIGWFTLRVADALDLSPSSDGSATALAGFLEESGKLIPLLVLAVLAPGRVRRFGAGDWAVLGFASGAAFNGYEDAMRQLAVQGQWFLWQDPSRVYSWNPWASGQFVSTDGVALSPGHHIWTVAGAMGIGLGIALWRTRRACLRALAVVLPTALVLWQIADHASFNAHNNQSSWPAEPAPGFPTILSGVWSAGGHGRFLSIASAVLLVACLLIDVHRRHRAARLAPAGLDRSQPGGAVNDDEPGQRVLGWWATTVNPQVGPGRTLERVGSIAIRALAQWTADIGVVLAAHAPLAGESRRAAVLRGRTIAVGVRHIRGEAMDLTTPGTEPETRRRFAAAAAVLGSVAVVVCVLWGAHVAAAVGTYLQLDGDGVYLAGLLDGVGDWWNGLSGWQQIAVGAGVAALVTLSGGSLGLAMGISGVATYGLSHAEGAATFTRDPTRATADYLSTTTPFEASLDAGEFILTFLPGNFAGAAAGRGARSLLSPSGRVLRRAEPPLPSSAAIEEWIGDVNPGYTGDPFDPRSVNCGRCAESVQGVLHGGPLKPAGPGTYSIEEMEAITGLRQIEMTPEEIAEALSSGGAGSHAVVGIDRAAGSGHWFNAYFDGDRVVAVDGQTGQILDWPPDFGAIRWDAAIWRANG
ncbi:toxin glutamine deamidase domain-containing protein [Cellulomonas sp. URHB0016]